MTHATSYIRISMLAAQMLGTLGIILAVPFTGFFFVNAGAAALQGLIGASLPGFGIAIALIALPILSGTLAFLTIRNKISRKHTISAVVVYALTSLVLIAMRLEITYPYLIVYGVIVAISFCGERYMRG